MSDHATVAVRAPLSWRSMSWQTPDDLARLGSRGFIVGAVGVALLAIGFISNRQQFFLSYLVAYLFWLSIALGSLAVSMLHHLSRGAWGLLVRRILEAAARTLPAMLILFVPILFGLGDLYPWARPAEVAASELLQHKAPYLNRTFFIIRLVLYFAIWCWMALSLSRLSKRQDETNDPSLARRMQVISAPGLVIFALTITFAIFDWLMSLDPEWFSTIYGVWFLGGMGLATFAFLIVMATYLVRREPMSQALAPRHFHDYGKLMFAFTLLWAYFSFSQFLIIWSANLPEEIVFYLHRSRHGWQWMSLLLVIGHFALPFVLLLSRNLKRTPPKLVKIALLILVMRWVDFYWQAAPTFHPETLLPHWLDVAAMAGIGGIWFGLFVRELRSRSLLPLNAPNLEEALGE